MKEIVLLQELFQLERAQSVFVSKKVKKRVHLALNISYSVSGERVFIQRHFCFLQISQKPKFAF